MTQVYEREVCTFLKSVFLNNCLFCFLFKLERWKKVLKTFKCTNFVRMQYFPHNIFNMLFCTPWGQLWRWCHSHPNFSIENRNSFSTLTKISQNNSNFQLHIVQISHKKAAANYKQTQVFFSSCLYWETLLEAAMKLCSHLVLWQKIITCMV